MMNAHDINVTHIMRSDLSSKIASPSFVDMFLNYQYDGFEHIFAVEIGSKEFNATGMTIVTVWLHNIRPFEEGGWLVIPSAPGFIYPSFTVLIKDDEDAMRFKISWSA